MTNHQQGSASLLVLILTLFLSVLAASAGVVLQLAVRQLKRGEQRDERRRILVQEAERTLRLLLADPTPEADSPRDPVWDSIGQPLENGCTVELQDLSSRLGLNWVRKEVVDSLAVLKRPAQELQQFREDTGLHLNLTPAFEVFFDEDDLGAFFTAYNWFNINIGEELALRQLHFTRGGDLAAAEEFHAAVQRLRAQKKTVAPDQLEQAIGASSYQLLYPILNAEPVMNLHFVPGAVLRALFLHYQAPQEKAETILAARSGSELSASQLEGLFGSEAYRNTPLRQYLGVRTWFWRITVTRGEDSVSWVVARLPRRESQGTPEAPVEYRLLEERFTP